jgi:hypothetical protein
MATRATTCDGLLQFSLGSATKRAVAAWGSDRWRRMDRVTKPSEAGESENSNASLYPVWSDSCWIELAAESADGTGPRIGRIVGRETRCPDGRRQRLCHTLGVHERNVGELELRILLRPGEDGVCQVIVEEREDEVYVRVLVHRADEDDASARPSRRYLESHVRVELDEPLGARAVIDFDRDEELPLDEPKYLNNVRQRDHGRHH